MQRLLLIISIIVFGLNVKGQYQAEDFSSQWKVIDSLILKSNLPKSALIKVEAIYKQSKANNWSDMTIKALLYKMSLAERITENNGGLNLSAIEDEIKITTDLIPKAILATILAKNYFSYYTNMRWEIMYKKNSAVYDQHNLDTWSAVIFKQKINTAFNEALKHKQLLQNISIKQFSSIINGNTGNYFNANIFDLLAYEAINYYKDEYAEKVETSTAELIKEEALLSTASAFLKTKFVEKDTSSSISKIIHLYQEILQIHEKDKERQIFVQTNIERIKWANSFLQTENKNKLYIKALEEIAQNNQDVSTSINAWYLLAEAEKIKGDTYNAQNDSSNRFCYKKALEISKNAKEIFDENNWIKSGLYNLTEEIHRKKILPTVEKINATGKPFRALITYKNVDTVYARVIKIENNTIKQSDNDLLKTLLSKQNEITYIQELPKVNDYQQHSVEIKMEALSSGRYVMICSNSKNFKEEEDYISSTYFNVSNLTYLKDNDHYFIRDYNHGLAIGNVRVNLYSSKYDYNTGITNYTFQRQIQSNENGEFRLISSKSLSENCVFELIKGKDYLWADENEYLYGREVFNYLHTSDSSKYEEESKGVLLYTDRSIYRPNQIVYFKGISIKKNFTTKLYQVNNQQKAIKVFLRDANYIIKDSLILIPNEYGSVTGNFTVKEGGVNGRYTIEAENYHQSTVTFMVEEYKRPNFDIILNNKKEQFILNKPSVIKGSAVALAGNVINNSVVHYSIKQISISPFNELRRMHYPNFGEKSIAEGRTLTNDKGEFSIQFLPELAVENNTALIEVVYAITVSITDLNGETRTNNSTIIAANYTGKIDISHIGVVERSKFTTINTKFSNLYGTPQNATIVIQLEKAVVPEKLIRARFWEKPDQFILSAVEFANYFPIDVFANEDDYKKYTYRNFALNDSIINTNKTNSLAINDVNIDAGLYKIIATTVDSIGKKIVATDYVFVYDLQKRILPIQTYNYDVQKNYEGKPGDTIRLLHLNGLNSMPIIRKIKRGNNDKEEYSYLTLNKIDETELIVTEKDRGGIVITDSYVYGGRIYTQQYRINVPWNSLKIAYGSYKSITEPGSKEKYTVEVSGMDGSKKITELLCTMYDASLDQLNKHDWRLPYLWEHNMSSFITSNLFNVSPNREHYPYQNYKEIEEINFPQLFCLGEEILDKTNLEWNNYLSLTENNRIKRNFSALNESVIIGKTAKNAQPFPMTAIRIRGKNPIQEESYDKVYTPVDLIDPETGDRIINGRRININNTEPFVLSTRKNFEETAFFYPQLHADSTGKFSFEFTIPDAVTQWNWMSLAHSKDLLMGKQIATVITQKKLMVQPNVPRFFMEGDQLELATKIANLTENEISGTVRLELIDAATNRPVDGWFQNIFPNQYYTAEAGKSISVKFPIQIPFGYNKPLILKIVAKSGDYFDGIENTLPVLSKRQLVTESFPLLLLKDTVQHFIFESLKNQESESITHQSLTVEYTSSPIWNIVKALPYLIEDVNDNIVQKFNQFYANSMATYILERNPLIKHIFSKWDKDTTALLNQLEKNPALKQVLIQETPWVVDAQSQSIQLKQLVALFNAEKIKVGNEKCIQLLEEMQLNNGAFPWYKGGNENEYITQYILTGIGKLNRIGALPSNLSLRLKPLIIRAINYIDDKINREYEARKNSKTPLDQQEMYSWQIEQLYTRSYFNNIQPKDEKVIHYCINQGKKYWTKLNTYYQAMFAIILNRNGDINFATHKILPALLENTIQNKSQGLYWKNTITRYWYNSPIMHQSMMIDCFNEINQTAKNNEYTSNINKMRTWLILQKQTNYWESTVTTANVCYSLLQNGTNWLNNERKVYLQLGDFSVNSEQENTTAGTGYFYKKIAGEIVQPKMGKITIETITSSAKVEEKSQPSYGAIYWQYLEDIDKLKFSGGPISIQKNILVERTDSKGKVWITLKENESLHIGEKVTIQLTIKADRDMEYVHVKDMRVSGMEPLNVLSGYKWQDRIGYYEQTKDASTHFFIDQLNKGTYIINYELVATHEGLFTAGNASIQCMYAPEFISHSVGNIIRIEKQ